MPYIDDDTLKARLKDVLSKEEFETDTPWDTIVTDSNRAAKGNIKTALIKRGYTTAQILAWFDLESFNTDLGLYWSLVKGGTTKDWDETFINKLDRRAELETIDLIDSDGNIIEPAGVDAPNRGAIRSGTLANDNDRFGFRDDWGSN